MKQLQEAVRNRLNDYRAIERLISSFDFEYLYKRLGTQDQKLLSGMIITGDKLAALEFIERCESRAIEELSIRRLRQLAGQMCIEYYTRLDKAELIAIILKVKNDARIAG